jgi:acyl-CoA-dependent ceramide synthase
MLKRRDAVFAQYQPVDAMDALLDLSPTLPSFLRPFVSLSYPVPPPEHPDSFPTSTYHDIGRLDVCLVIGLIAFMALLRDAFRLLVLEPSARWKLMRDWRRRKASRSANASGTTTPTTGQVSSANGTANGNGYHAEKASIERLPENAAEPSYIKRNVIRFAEQGWMVIYYSWQFAFGLVR